MNNNNTKTEELQTQSASLLSQTLKEKIIIATEGEQHIKVEPGYVYEITKDGEFLGKDANLIAKKAGNDLEVLLENDSTIIFDNYFEVCADLSCVVSLPIEDGVYAVVEGNFIPLFLADGSQIVYFYGSETTLSTIANNQSSLFGQSFNDAFSSSSYFLGGSGNDVINEDNEDDLFSFNDIRDKTINEDILFNFTSNISINGDLTATQSNGSDLPDWLSFDAETRTFSGTPLNDDVGGVDVRVIATDGSDLATTDFAIVVNNVNDAPILNKSVDDMRAYQNGRFRLEKTLEDDTFIDVDVNDSLTYTTRQVNSDGTTQPLPDWLNFNAKKQTFSGTPQHTHDVGTIDVEVTATDKDGLSASDNFNLTVPGPRIAIQAGQNRYVNIEEDKVTLKISYVGMAAGDQIQLHNGSENLENTSHIVTDDDVAAGMATIDVFKDSLGPNDGATSIHAIVIYFEDGIIDTTNEITITLDTERPAFSWDAVQDQQKEQQIPYDFYNISPDVDKISVFANYDSVIKGSSDLAKGTTFNIAYAVDHRFFADQGLPYEQGKGDMYGGQSFWGASTVYPNPMPELLIDEGFGDAIKINDDGLGSTKMQRQISLMEWADIAEYGATLSFRMRMDDDDAAVVSGFIGVAVNRQLENMPEVVANSNKVWRWGCSIGKDSDTNEISVTTFAPDGRLRRIISIPNTVYNEYSLYELVLPKNLAENPDALLYINGEFATTVGLAKMPHTTLFSFQWHSGSNSGADRVVYFKDMGVTAWKGSTIQAAVIDDQGNWEATLPFDSTLMDRYITLATDAQDVAGNSVDFMQSKINKIFLDGIFVPFVTEFNVTPTDNDSWLEAPETIIITATINEVVDQGSTIIVILNSGVHVPVALTALEEGTVLTGVYEVRDTHQSDDLTVVSFTIDPDNPVIESVMGYEMTSTKLPTGNNIHDNNQVVINAPDSPPPTLISVVTSITQDLTEWTDLDNIRLSGNTIVQNLFGFNPWTGELMDWYVNRLWNSGAISKEKFSRDFAVSATVTKDHYHVGSTTQSAFGISSHGNGTVHVASNARVVDGVVQGYVDNSAHRSDIQYGMSKGRVTDDDDIDHWYAMVMIDGIGQVIKGSKKIWLEVGSVLTVKKQGRDILYLINQEEVHRLSGVVEVNEEFYVDTSIKHEYTQISDVKIEFETYGETVANSSVTYLFHIYNFSEPVKGLTRYDFHISTTNSYFISLEAIDPDSEGFSLKWKVKIMTYEHVMGDLILIFNNEDITDRTDVSMIKGLITEDQIIKVVKRDFLFVKDIQSIGGVNAINLTYNQAINPLSLIDKDAVGLNNYEDYEHYENYKITINDETRQIVNAFLSNDMKTMVLMYDGDNMTTTDTYSIEYDPHIERLYYSQTENIYQTFISTDNGTKASAFKATIGHQNVVSDGTDNFNFIQGSKGDDELRGGNAHDTIVGDDGDDTIIGGDGNDFIIGGSGNDTLTGDGGNNATPGNATPGGRDTFIYDNTDAGHDTITDFQLGVDTINLVDLLDFSTLDIDLIQKEINLIRSREYLSDFEIGLMRGKIDLADLAYLRDDEMETHKENYVFPQTNYLERFIKIEDNVAGDSVNSVIYIDANGDGSGIDVSITLTNLGGGGVDLFEMLNNGSMMIL